MLLAESRIVSPLPWIQPESSAPDPVSAEAKKQLAVSDRECVFANSNWRNLSESQPTYLQLVMKENTVQLQTSDVIVVTCNLWTLGLSRKEDDVCFRPAYF